VPKKGLEPPHPCGYMDLNHARLPIPPLRHIVPAQIALDGSNSQCYKGIQPCQTPRSPTRPTEFHPGLRPPMTLPFQPKSIPEQQAKEIRRLSHDLSNALEVVLQTSFLLGTVPLDDEAQKWRSMLDNGVQQAAELNRQLREYVRGNS
jgi:hypothetical protein